MRGRRRRGERQTSRPAHISPLYSLSPTPYAHMPETPPAPGLCHGNGMVPQQCSGPGYKQVQRERGASRKKPKAAVRRRVCNTTPSTTSATGAGTNPKEEGARKRGGARASGRKRDARLAPPGPRRAGRTVKRGVTHSTPARPDSAARGRHHHLSRRHRLSRHRLSSSRRRTSSDRSPSARRPHSRASSRKPTTVNLSSECNST